MRKYRILAYKDVEGDDDLYDARSQFREMEEFKDWIVTDVQQLPREDEVEVSPVQNRFPEVNLRQDGLDVRMEDGVVFVDGEAVGQYGDADEETQNIIDEHLGENREWRQLPSGDES